jgi:hypothetical protein
LWTRVAMGKWRQHTHLCMYICYWCMNSLYELDECCYQSIVFCFILCFILQTKCRLCFLSSSNGWADVNKSVAIVDSRSDAQMTSARPSLLWAIVAMDVFGPSLPSYHCSDRLVVSGHSDLRPVAIVPDCSSRANMDISLFNNFASFSLNYSFLLYNGNF